MEIKVGEIIKAKREEKKIPLIDMAERIGISPGYLSQIENGKKKNPKLEIVLKLITELDIDLKMLLGLEYKEEDYLLKIPSLMKLILAKDRNTKVLENTEILKKICSILERLLENKYIIENEQLYLMFLEDIYIQIDTILKRYLAMEILLNTSIES